MRNTPKMTFATPLMKKHPPSFFHYKNNHFLKPFYEHQGKHMPRSRLQGLSKKDFFIVRMSPCREILRCASKGKFFGAALARQSKTHAKYQKTSQTLNQKT